MAIPRFGVVDEEDTAKLQQAFDPALPLPRIEFPPRPAPPLETPEWGRERAEQEAWEKLDGKGRAALVLEEVVLRMTVRRGSVGAQACLAASSDRSPRMCVDMGPFHSHTGRCLHRVGPRLPVALER